MKCPLCGESHDLITPPVRWGEFRVVACPWMPRDRIWLGGVSRIEVAPVDSAAADG